MLQKEIKDLETHINEGAYLRCGAKWKCESEAPSKVFFQCEKWKGQQRFIGIVEVDGETPGTTRQIINQPEIENTIRTFYENWEFYPGGLEFSYLPRIHKYRTTLLFVPQL